MLNVWWALQNPQLRDIFFLAVMYHCLRNIFYLENTLVSILCNGTYKTRRASLLSSHTRKGEREGGSPVSCSGEEKKASALVLHSFAGGKERKTSLDRICPILCNKTKLVRRAVGPLQKTENYSNRISPVPPNRKKGSASVQLSHNRNGFNVQPLFPEVLFHPAVHVLFVCLYRALFWCFLQTNE